MICLPSNNYLTSVRLHRYTDKISNMIILIFYSNYVANKCFILHNLHQTYLSNFFSFKVTEFYKNDIRIFLGGFFKYRYFI
jgi:hypothetical protein